MSDRSFVRLMFLLLLLISGCLVVLDQQKQRQLAAMRKEIDNLHGRMNGAGLLDALQARQDEAGPAPAAPAAGEAARLERRQAVVDALTAATNQRLAELAEKEV